MRPRSCRSRVATPVGSAHSWGIHPRRERPIRALTQTRCWHSSRQADIWGEVPMRDEQPTAAPIGETTSPDDLVQTLAAIDVDGALRETAAEAVRATRREWLRALPLAGAMGA